MRRPHQCHITISARPGQSDAREGPRPMTSPLVSTAIARSPSPPRASRHAIDDRRDSGRGPQVAQKSTSTGWPPCATRSAAPPSAAATKVGTCLPAGLWLRCSARCRHRSQTSSSAAGNSPPPRREDDERRAANRCAICTLTQARLAGRRHAAQTAPTAARQQADRQCRPQA